MARLESLFPLQRFTVQESSMLPGIKSGSDVLVFKWLKPHVSDVVVAWYDDRFIIKRVKDIKDGNYFLIGDNDQESTDSRHFGMINRHNILGKVILISHQN
jgi:nickel-type superoxide dismutase maturation protease